MRKQIDFLGSSAKVWTRDKRLAALAVELDKNLSV
jgi:hypothetical protein